MGSRTLQISAGEKLHAGCKDSAHIHYSTKKACKSMKRRTRHVTHCS